MHWDKKDTKLDGAILKWLCAATISEDENVWGTEILATTRKLM